VIGEIRLNIHMGNLARAQEQLNAESAQALSQGRVHRQIKLHVLETLLQSRMGDHGLARRSLRKALRLAQAGDFVRAFLEEGEGIVTLLRTEQRACEGTASALYGGSMQFVHRLLEAAGIGGGEEPARDAALDDGAPEPLTEREIQILVQLTNGVSNRQMAGKIFVSENTVKYHLKNIYTKLKVSGRVQAINAARDLGLVR
jgi:LuxR family maltose regulon positive regulatory protein